MHTYTEIRILCATLAVGGESIYTMQVYGNCIAVGTWLTSLGYSGVIDLATPGKVLLGQKNKKTIGTQEPNPI